MKRKILVVEDEWIIANDIKDALAEMGYRVTTIAASGDDALASVEEERPDLILMDIVLKGKMNGIETARAIRARHDIPVIYLTAYDNQFLVNQAKQTDSFGYLLKPFKNRELHIAIDMALHKKEQERQRGKGGS
ncbi:MAG: response regulator [Desulfobacteraceae bacterium]|nr:response regulator [Desulfobacteraceae bacterium]